MQVIIQTIVTNSMAENAHVVCVKDTREAFVAAPGGAADEIIEACEAQGCRLTDILLTHGHFDHIQAVAELHRRTGAHIRIRVVKQTNHEGSVDSGKTAAEKGYFIAFAPPRVFGQKFFAQCRNLLCRGRIFRP